MSANRLLVAEDDLALGAFIARVATECGYVARVCAEGESLAAEIAAGTATHVFVDLLMPGVDGIEILRQLAAARSRARILIVSGLDEKILESARRFGIESGLDIIGTLMKPFSLSDLRELLTRIKHDTDWLTVEALAKAIDNAELILEYQPTLDLRTGRVAGVEALVRWSHPQRGRIPPSDFLPLAESDQIIDRLTDYVIRTALAQVAAWREGGLDLPVAINVSGRNLHDLALIDRLTAECARLDVPPQHVTLELTESAAMEDGLRAIEILTRMRLKGFGLSIDDFGTGYSSLVQLHRLPFCELKIDRMFIAECDTGRDGLVFVRTMIDLAHNLGLRACAEGVESDAVVKLLKELGCDRLQGFHFARPMAGKDVVEWSRRLAPPEAPKDDRPA